MRTALLALLAIAALVGCGGPANDRADGGPPRPEVDLTQTTPEIKARLDAWRAAPDDTKSGENVYLALTDERNLARTLTGKERDQAYGRLLESVNESLRLLASQPESELGRLADFRNSLEELKLAALVGLGRWDEVDTAAKELLARADAGTWTRGDVVHEANMALARVALARNDPAAAGAALVAASKSTGSPSLNSSGPRAPVIPDLLKADQRDAVIAYLKGIRTFWESHQRDVDQWIDTVRAGQTPEDADWQLLIRD